MHWSPLAIELRCWRQALVLLLQMLRGLVVLATVLIGGCFSAPSPNTDDETLSRDTAETLVKSYIKEHFNDPYSVRDLEIGTPKRTFNLFGKDEPWWLIPFKRNSKNAFGAYTGKKWRALPAIKKGEEWFYNYGLDSEVAWNRYSDENPGSSQFA